MMKKILLITWIFFIALGYVQAQTGTLFNTNWVDVEQGRIVKGITITFKEGVITEISKAGKKIRKGQKDCTGLYVMPGLIDSHTHWASFGMLPEYMQSMTKSYLADGVTTVRDAGGDMRTIIKYQADLDSGKIVGPTVYMSSFWAGPDYYKGIRRDTKGYKTVNAPWNMEIYGSTTVAEYEKAIIEAKEYGCIGLKLYNDITARQLNEIIPLCHKHGIIPWAHFSTYPATAMEVVKSGVQTVSHTALIDGIKGIAMTNDIHKADSIRSLPIHSQYRDSVFKEMVRRGTILDATVKIYMDMGKKHGYVAQYTKEAYRAGVKIAAGTDFLAMDKDGFKSIFLDELEQLHQSCGMKTVDVLRAATIVGAEVIGKSGKLGVIRKGAEADFLILKRNPLEDLSALREQVGLYLDGKQVNGQR